MRGCATDIFAVANTAAASVEYESDKKHYTMPISRLAPGEIELLHHIEMCTFLPIQELWPELFPKPGFTNLKFFIIKLEKN